MKYTSFFIFLISLIYISCDKPKVGYLSADNAEYIPDSLIVKNIHDLDAEFQWSPDYLRVQNDAPWVTLKIEKVLGTPPLQYRFISVKATDGGDAEAFQDALNVRGAGIMEIPLKHNIPTGRYVVSIEVSNEGYSEVIQDAFTFIIK